MRLKKVNFLGYTVEIVEDTDIDEMQASGDIPLYSMIRIADADPRGGSPALRERRTVVACQNCGAGCWFDPKSYEPIARLSPLKVCLQCTSARVKAEQHGDDEGRRGPRGTP